MTTQTIPAATAVAATAVAPAATSDMQGAVPDPQLVVAMADQGLSPGQIASRLNKVNYRTSGGGKWYDTTVFNLLRKSTSDPLHQRWPKVATCAAARAAAGKPNPAPVAPTPVPAPAPATHTVVAGNGTTLEVTAPAAPAPAPVAPPSAPVAAAPKTVVAKGTPAKAPEAPKSDAPSPAADRHAMVMVNNSQRPDARARVVVCTSFDDAMTLLLNSDPGGADAMLVVRADDLAETLKAHGVHRVARLG